MPFGRSFRPRSRRKARNVDQRPCAPFLRSKFDKMNNNSRYDTEEARQWAITFRLMTLAIALAGLIIGVLAVRG
jgi:hypothetical protein